MAVNGVETLRRIAEMKNGPLARLEARCAGAKRRVVPVSTPQKPHRGCPRSLALGDRGDSGPQLARRSPRSSRIGPGKRPRVQE